jgi:hypothetical protein
MLKALARWILRSEPVKTQRKPEQFELDLVPRAEFDAAIQRLEQRIEWDLSEWYDKFSTLHARTAKRAQRQQNGKGGEQVEQSQPTEPRRSVLAYRKPWSV